MYVAPLTDAVTNPGAAHLWFVCHDIDEHNVQLN